MHDDFIDIHWTEEREDNDHFVPVAEFLKKARPKVPEILYDRSHHRVALVQDLGDTDLLSPKVRTRTERFLHAFYDIVNDPERLEARILSKCRG